MFPPFNNSLHSKYVYGGLEPSMGGWENKWVKADQGISAHIAQPLMVILPCPTSYHAPPAVYLHEQKWTYFLPDSNPCLSVLSHTSSCTDHLFVCSSSHAVCPRVLVLSFVLPLFSPCLHIPSIDKIRNRNVAILLEKPHCSWLVDGIIEDGINAALRNDSQRPSCIINSPFS